MARSRIFGGSTASIPPVPATDAPAIPAPAIPAPAIPAPVTPAPATPAPVTPAPAIPAPATPVPATVTPVIPEMRVNYMTCKETFIYWYGKECLNDDLTRKFIAHAVKNGLHDCPKCYETQNVWVCKEGQLMSLGFKIVAANLSPHVFARRYVLCESCGYFGLAD